MGIRWLAGEPERRRFGDLTVQAVEAFVADRAQPEAAFAWYRPTRQDVDRFRDGLHLDGQALPPLTTVPASCCRRRPASRATGTGSGARARSTSPPRPPSGCCWSAGATRRTGCAPAAWQRLHPWATTRGPAPQPLDQVPIRAEREVELGLAPRFGRAQAELIGDAAWHPALAFRLGYPTVRVPPSPRRSVLAVLEDGRA